MLSFIIVMLLVLSYTSQCYKFDDFIGFRRKHLKEKLEPLSESESETTKSQLMLQFIDHFDKNNNSTWYQVSQLCFEVIMIIKWVFLRKNSLRKRYFVNKKFFAETGPVFLFIHGEAKANLDMMRNGFWIEQAKKFVINSFF